ncbi:hypothetical protein KKC13_01120 [bacterium]|nr:hypothetical protein [bacterium]
MVKFNPLIEKKIEESDSPKEIKKFLKKALQLELQSSSAGIKYPYTKELEFDIKQGAVKLRVEQNED